MSHLKLENIIKLLKNFTEATNSDLELILIGGLSLHYYSMNNRATVDIDAEVKGDIEGLSNFLKLNKIPSDMGENISGWSIISLPCNYRERAIVIYKDNLLTIKVLDPIDFVISKLRRFTDEDIEDSKFAGSNGFWGYIAN